MTNPLNKFAMIGLVAAGLGAAMYSLPAQAGVGHIGNTKYEQMEQTIANTDIMPIAAADDAKEKRRAERRAKRRAERQEKRRAEQGVRKRGKLTASQRAKRRADRRAKRRALRKREIVRCRLINKSIPREARKSRVRTCVRAWMAEYKAARRAEIAKRRAARKARRKTKI